MSALQLNLLPNIKKEYLKSRIQRNLVISGSILITAVSAGVIVLLFTIVGGQQLQKNILQGKIEETSSKIAQIKDINAYLTLQNQLSQTSKLKDSQAQYSRLFDYLQKVVIPKTSQNAGISLSQVSLGDSAADGSNGVSTSITLTGATDTFATLAIFKTILSKTTIAYSTTPDGKVIKPVALFSSIKDASAPSLSAAQGGAQSVGFSLTLSYDPKIFSIDTYNMVLDTPSAVISNSTSNTPVFVQDNGSSSSDNSDNVEVNK